MLYYFTLSILLFKSLYELGKYISDYKYTASGATTTWVLAQKLIMQYDNVETKLLTRLINLALNLLEKSQ